MSMREHSAAQFFLQKVDWSHVRQTAEVPVTDQHILVVVVVVLFFQPLPEAIT